MIAFKASARSQPERAMEKADDVADREIRLGVAAEEGTRQRVHGRSLTDPRPPVARFGAGGLDRRRGVCLPER